MSACLLVVLLFSEQGDTMQCAEHKAKTETNQTVVSVFQKKNPIIYLFFENRNAFQILKPLHH